MLRISRKESHTLKGVRLPNNGQASSEESDTYILSRGYIFQIGYNMKIETYKTTKGTVRYRPVLTEKQYIRCESNYIGFCVACGEPRDGCEPDARRYECHSCNQNLVYGIPELLMMGIVRIVN